MKTPAGTFEACIKIEYWMEDDREASKKVETAKPTSSDVSDIEKSTLWLAPNVGIVKFIRTSTTSKVEKSLELTQYKIRSIDSDGK